MTIKILELGSLFFFLAFYHYINQAQEFFRPWMSLFTLCVTIHATVVTQFITFYLEFELKDASLIRSTWERNFLPVMEPVIPHS